MTWKYPQPRTLTRVSIFPVPFKKASDLGTAASVEDSEEVACSLQYWDACLASFRTYSEFHLSETHVSHLDLPLTTDRKKVAVSTVWRVVLDHDVLDNEDDFDRVDREIIVQPKSLVSVMRVDSYVNPGLVPKLQAAVDVSRVRVSVQNHLHFHGQALPPPSLNR